MGETPLLLYLKWGEDMQEQQKQDLIKLIEPILVKNKVILYNLDYRKDKSNYVLEILIERANGAMDLDTCVQVSQELSILLDDIPFLKDEYTLEVASPGVERPLKSLEQFQKALGKYVYIKTKNPIDKYQEFFGDLKEVNPASLVLECRDKTRLKKITIEMSNIQDAMTTVKF